MSGSRLLILYASQTGNSQDVAERICREAQARLLRPSVLAMDAYNVLDLPQERLVIFVASTTGQGEAPSNMKKFWPFLLRKALQQDSLCDMRYAIFGLGDSGYLNYNVVAKKLDRRLAALGAQELLPRGLGDDQHSLGYEATLDSWLKELWAQMRLIVPLPGHATDNSSSPAASSLGTPRYKVTVLPSPDSNRPPELSNDHVPEAMAAAYAFGQLEACAAGIGRQHDTLADPLSETSNGFSMARPCLASLTKNQRLTAPDHFQDTRHIEFDLGPDGPKYQPGDILSIFPHQDDAAVDAVLARVGIDPQQLIQVEVASPPGADGRHSMEARAGAFVQGVLDVHSASPRRFLFEVMQHFAQDELHRDRLEYFGSAQGREDLALYNHKEGRTVLEALQDFSSVSLPFEWLIQVCPRLQPRQFSIASSQAAHLNQAHITLALVYYLTPFKRRKRGLCSTWLSTLPLGAKVPVWTERGVLHLPKDPHVPLIMIGPGTGIAPFRAFLEERDFLQAEGTQLAPAYLFFGCRNADKDFYYREQLVEMMSKGVLAKGKGLITAFSRDQPHKVYVSHRLAEHAQQMAELLEQGACLYVCGSAEKMPQEIAAVIRQKLLVEQSGLSDAEAQKFMRRLEFAGRYVVEAWS